jgi:hypothetical protein
MGGKKKSITQLLPNVKAILLEAVTAKFPRVGSKSLQWVLSRRFTLAGDDLGFYIKYNCLTLLYATLILKLYI